MWKKWACAAVILCRFAWTAVDVGAAQPEPDLSRIRELALAHYRAKPDASKKKQDPQAIEKLRDEILGPYHDEKKDDLIGEPAELLAAVQLYNEKTGVGDAYYLHALREVPSSAWAAVSDRCLEEAGHDPLTRDFWARCALIAAAFSDDLEATRKALEYLVASRGTNTPAAHARVIDPASTIITSFGAGYARRAYRGEASASWVAPRRTLLADIPELAARFEDAEPVALGTNKAVYANLEGERFAGHPFGSIRFRLADGAQVRGIAILSAGFLAISDTNDFEISGLYIWGGHFGRCRVRSADGEPSVRFYYNGALLGNVGTATEGHQYRINDNLFLATALAKDGTGFKRCVFYADGRPVPFLSAQLRRRNAKGALEDFMGLVYDVKIPPVNLGSRIVDLDPDTNRDNELTRAELEAFRDRYIAGVIKPLRANPDSAETADYLEKAIRDIADGIASYWERLPRPPLDQLP